MISKPSVVYHSQWIQDYILRFFKTIKEFQYHKISEKISSDVTGYVGGFNS